MKDEISEQDLELLSAALDGDCADPDALRARLHAEPELARRMRQLQAMRARLASLAAPVPAADFAEHVTRRAYARKFSASGRKLWWGFIPAAAAALLLVVAGLHRTPPKQQATAFDEGVWRDALTAVAESPDAETLEEWVDEEPALEDALPYDLAGTLADLSSREPGGTEETGMEGLDTGASIVDMINQLTDEDATVLAARLRAGA